MSGRMSDERLTEIAVLKPDETFIPYPAHAAYELYRALIAERDITRRIVKAWHEVVAAQTAHAEMLVGDVKEFRPKDTRDRLNAAMDALGAVLSECAAIEAR